MFEAAQAVWNAFYGNREAARQKAESALNAFDGREGARAEGLAAKLNKDHPEDTQVQSIYVPTLRALAALGRNDAPKALDLLEANRRYEFGIPPLAFNHFYGNVYPLYARGLAYLAMLVKRKRPRNSGDPVDAAARRQLAHATKTQSSYNDIMTLWTKASSDPQRDESRVRPSPMTHTAPSRSRLGNEERLPSGAGAQAVT